MSTEIRASLFVELFGRWVFIDMKVDMLQTSCGFAVPLMDYKPDRDVLTIWAKNKGEGGINDYWEERNQTSLDGKPTEILLAGREPN